MKALGRRGFQFEETMSGTYTPVDSPERERALSFTVCIQAPSLLRHARDGRADLSGVLDADGLATRVPIEGSVILRPYPGGRIRYEFRFTGDDGEPYVFRGQKDIRVRALSRTLTELPAEIRTPRGALIATCETRFAVASEWRRFLGSFRLTRSGQDP